MLCGRRNKIRGCVGGRGATRVARDNMRELWNAPVGRGDARAEGDAHGEHDHATRCNGARGKRWPRWPAKRRLSQKQVVVFDQAFLPYLKPPRSPHPPQTLPAQPTYDVRSSSRRRSPGPPPERGAQGPRQPGHPRHGLCVPNLSARQKPTLTARLWDILLSSSARRLTLPWRA